MSQLVFFCAFLSILLFPINARSENIAHRNIKRYFNATNISVNLSFIKLLQSFLEIKFALRPTMSPKIKYGTIRFKIIKTVLYTYFRKKIGLKLDIGKFITLNILVIQLLINKNKSVKLKQNNK